MIDVGLITAGLDAVDPFYCKYFGTLVEQMTNKTPGQRSTLPNVLTRIKSYRANIHSEFKTYYKNAKNALKDQNVENKEKYERAKSFFKKDYKHFVKKAKAVIDGTYWESTDPVKLAFYAEHREMINSIRSDRRLIL